MLALAFLLYYIMPEFSIVKLFEPYSLMGILAGIGIGLIFGGIVGYVSKGSAIKQEQQRKAYKQLVKEKEELARQAAENARLQQQSEFSSQDENTQTY